MPQAVFNCSNTCAIDAIAPNATYTSIGDVGVFLIGGSKGILRRALATFDVFGAATSGRPLNSTDVVVLAELLGEVTGINGPAFQVDTERLTRANYNGIEATWNNYRAGTPWTAAGGDVDTVPAAASFTSPATPGDQVVQANLAPFVIDAVANRGGLVVLRWRAHNENPGVTSIYTTFAAPSHVPALRLRVTYQSLAPTPIEHPRATSFRDGGIAGVAQPDRPASPEHEAKPAPASRT